MRGFALAAMALLTLAACNRKEGAAPEADVQKGIDRSVADVRAAEAATAAPITESRSVGELTRKADAPGKAGAPAGKEG